MAAVMCIGETKHSPSVTPLFRTICSTWSVMCTISRRFLVSKTRYSVWLFISWASPQLRMLHQRVSGKNHEAGDRVEQDAFGPNRKSLPAQGRASCHIPKSSSVRSAVHSCLHAVGEYRPTPAPADVESTSAP